MRRFRRYNNINRVNLLLITFMLIFFSIVYLLGFINNKVSPILIEYAETEMVKFARLIANKTVVKEINDTISTDDLFIISRNNEVIQTIDFNPIAVNRLLSIITSSIESDFNAIASGNYDVIGLDSNVLINYNGDDLKRGIVFNIPSGIIFNNAFLTNLGPKIPVRFSLAGNIGSNIETKITNYGINNALVEANAIVDINMRIILPFVTEYTNIKVTIPLIIKLINGTVPNYYYNGISGSSSILTVPIE